ncbi:MAG: DinB family protein [Pseudomonadota bacterium]
MTPFLEMALNNAWANATFYRALAGLPEGGFQAKRPGFFGSLQATMNHIYEVDLYYIDALVEGGLGRAVYRREDISDPAELGRLQAESDARLAQFCRTLTPEILLQDRQTERQDGMTTERVERLLPHLFQHQVHHRGQAHVQLQDAGVAPPQLDDFFLDHGRVPSARAYWS